MEEMWIARDRDGNLMLFRHKPSKVRFRGVWYGNISYMLPNYLFPEVKGSDEEPTKVKLVIEK